MADSNGTEKLADLVLRSNRRTAESHQKSAKKANNVLKKSD